MNSATVIATAKTERLAIQPQVEIRGIVFPGMTCLGVELTTGVMPGSAKIRYATADPTGTPRRNEDNSPITLNRFSWSWQPGARVRVFFDRPEGGQSTIFLGALLERQDSGAQDAVIWTARDDRVGLAQIPIRGCLVYDDALKTATTSAKFIRRDLPQVNPGGYWNCVGAKISGEIFPVFSPEAHLGQSYQIPTISDAKDLQVGVPTFWTPRRWLMYLWLLANLPADGAAVAGVVAGEWRSLRSRKGNGGLFDQESARLMWDRSTITSLVGIDPAGGYGTSIGGDSQTQGQDPLDRKMPDTNFAGQKMLGVLCKTLDMAGTHGLRLIPYMDGAFVWYSKIDFFPCGFSTTRDLSRKNAVIPLQRGGVVDDINTAHDFQVVEDWTNTCEAVLVEGAPVHVEGEIGHYPASPTTSAIKPAWSQGSAGTGSQDYAFKFCINGGAGPIEPGKFAKMPITQDPANGFIDTSAFVDCDGSEYPPSSGKFRPLIYPKSAAAFKLARSLWPYCYRGFYIDSAVLATAGITAGYDNRYADTNKYPVLSAKRPALPEQAQYFISNLTGTDSISNQLRERYPIRFQVANEFGEYHDAGYIHGLHFNGDGVMLLDQVSEAAEAASTAGEYNDCIYSGSLGLDELHPKSPFSAVLNAFKLNICFPLDHRVMAQRNSLRSDMDWDYANDLGGAPLCYVDSPQAYQEIHQINSTPSYFANYYTGTTAIVAPINRLLPTGDEQQYAAAAAQRKIYEVQFPHRNSQWHLIGIRDDYLPGQWIESVQVRGGPTGDADYLINGSIDRISYIFHGQQETILGGLLSNHFMSLL